jgi:tetratricopeptide (TPR) repeat protein
LLLVREYGNRKWEVDIYVQLANACISLGDYQKAEEYYGKGMDVARRLGYTIGIIDLMGVLAVIHENRKSFEEGLTALKQALELATQAGDRNRIRGIQDAIVKTEKYMAKKVFVSYNHNDRRFVEKLSKDLKKKRNGCLVG